MAASVGSHQFHCRDKRTGGSPCLFCYETVSEHLYRCAGTAGRNAKTEHPLHGHPPGIRIYRLAERRKTLSATDAAGKGSQTDCTGTEPPPTGSGDRLALCHYRLFLANDSAPDMETIPIRTGQKPTEKIARSDNRSFSKTRYICPGTQRNKNNEERY